MCPIYPIFSWDVLYFFDLCPMSICQCSGMTGSVVFTSWHQCALMRGHIGARRRIRLMFVCGGNEALCQITLTTCCYLLLFCWLNVLCLMLYLTSSWDTGKVNKDNKIITKNLRRKMSWVLGKYWRNLLLNSGLRMDLTTFQITVIIFKEKSLCTLW